VIRKGALTGGSNYWTEMLRAASCFPGASGNSNQKSMAAAATPGRSGAMLCQHYEWSERWCEEMEEEKASGIPTLFLDRA